MDSATARQLLGIVGLLAVAGLAAALFSLTSVVMTLEDLTDRPVVFLGALVGVYLVRPFLLWPVSAVAVVLGYVYSPLLALPLALGGAALTAVPPFLIGRSAETDAGLFGSLRSSGAWATQVVGETQSVIAGRLSPVPGDAVSYWAGLSGVAGWPFFTGTVIGEVPWAVAAIIAGQSMRTLSVDGATGSPTLILGLAALALLVLAGPAYERLSHNHRQES